MLARVVNGGSLVGAVLLLQAFFQTNLFVSAQRLDCPEEDICLRRIFLRDRYTLHYTSGSDGTCVEVCAPLISFETTGLDAICGPCPPTTPSAIPSLAATTTPPTEAPIGTHFPTPLPEALPTVTPAMSAVPSPGIESKEPTTAPAPSPVVAPATQVPTPTEEPSEAITMTPTDPPTVESSVLPTLMSTMQQTMGSPTSSPASERVLTPVLLINAGGTPPYTDTSGRVWVRDTIPFTDPSTNGFRHTQDSDTSIAGTEDDELYRYYRWRRRSDGDGSLYYNIPVSSGTYVLQLHFAELRWDAAGVRIFDILVNGNLVVAAFDCFEEAGGADTAVVVEIPPMLVTSGMLNLEFRTISDHAMVAAIGIFVESTGPLETPAPTPVLVISPAPTVEDEGATLQPTSGSTMPPTFARGVLGLMPVALINVGDLPFTDSLGQEWERDTLPFTDPTINGFRHTLDRETEILGTQDDDLYRFYRWRRNSDDDGSLYYNIPMPGADRYIIQLHFAELRETAAGVRVFDILVEGNLVVEEFDCFEVAGGAATAVVLELPSIPVTDGTLSLEFRPINDHAMVAGIAVYADNPTLAPTASRAPTVAISRSPSSEPTITGEPTSNTDRWQPRIINVEGSPGLYGPHRAAGFIGMPRGSIWCQGRATYWWSGHDNRPEEPFCEEADGTWTKSSTAILDLQDDLNVIDGPGNIDRHACVDFDVNRDGTEDIICVVGANRGTGNGFNEVYLTDPADGSITKIDDIGLHKYPTMRTRFFQKLTAYDGVSLLAISNQGAERADGKSNAPRVFRHNETDHFEEVEGPYSVDAHAACLEVGDMNNDGVDDFIICGERGPSKGFIQDPIDGSWTQLDWSSLDSDYLDYWNGARIADVTGDGLADLLVAGPWHAFLGINIDPYFRVYPGVEGLETLFDFANPLIDDVFPYETMDVEVIDLNDDGLLDFYVVLWDLTNDGSGGYCDVNWSWREYWAEEFGHDDPPPDYVPPPDIANDYLYLSVDGSSWDRIKMQHMIPGCGSHVKKWKDKSLAVSHGDLSRPGYNVILEWN